MGNRLGTGGVNTQSTQTGGEARGQRDGGWVGWRGIAEAFSRLEITWTGRRGRLVMMAFWFGPWSQERGAESQVLGV